MLVSFRALLRKAIVTESEASIKRGGFTFFDWWMVIVNRKNKIIQFSERVLEILVERCCDPVLCAVHWVEHHFRQLPVDEDQEAFHLPDGAGGSTALTYGIHPQTLKLFSGRAGLEAEHFTFT